MLTPDVMAPILANPEVQQRLLPYLPSGESLPQSADEIQNTLTSPQFQQVSQAHDALRLEVLNRIDKNSGVDSTRTIIQQWWKCSTLLLFAACHKMEES